MAKVEMPTITSNEEKENHKPKKLDKVIKGEVKKKLGTSKILSNEFVKEEPSYVRDYILGEVVLPAVKNLIADIINNGVSMFLFGETRAPRRGDARDRGRYSQRDRYYQRDEYDEPRERRYRNRMRYDDFSHIILTSRVDAITVLNDMRDYIEDYGSVTVSNLYELVGEDSQGIDNSYGWTNLDRAYIKEVRDGYIIEFPKAKYLGD
jgi:hypothetical protein